MGCYLKEVGGRLGNKETTSRDREKETDVENGVEGVIGEQQSSTSTTQCLLAQNLPCLF